MSNTDVFRKQLKLNIQAVFHSGFAAVNSLFYYYRIVLFSLKIKWIYTIQNNNIQIKQNKRQQKEETYLIISDLLSQENIQTISNEQKHKAKQQQLLTVGMDSHYAIPYYVKKQTFVFLLKMYIDLVFFIILQTISLSYSLD